MRRASMALGKELKSDDEVCATCEQSIKEDKGSVKSWLRFGVRWIDYTVLFIVIRILVVRAGGFPQFLEGNGITFFIQLYLTIPLEALFISVVGTTPGKWLGRIRVSDLEGGRASYRQALQRTFWVWVKGLGLGIPLVNYVSMWFARKKLIRDGKTWWDETAGTKVEHIEIPLWRYILVLIVAVALFLLINVSIIDYVFNR